MASEFWTRMVSVTPGMSNPDRVALCRTATGVSQPSVSRWKTGEAVPTRENMKAIAKATGANYAFLLDGAEPMMSGDPVPFAPPQDAELLKEVLEITLKLFLKAGMSPEDHTDLFVEAAAQLYESAARAGSINTKLVELALAASKSA